MVGAAACQYTARSAGDLVPAAGGGTRFLQMLQAAVRGNDEQFERFIAAFDACMHKTKGMHAQIIEYLIRPMPLGHVSAPLP